MGTLATARFRHLAAASTKELKQQNADSANLHYASDEALVGLVKAGNQEGLSFLFRRYAATVRNIGMRILRDACEADDLVQEVFLYIHRKSVLFDAGKGSARSWVFQIAYTQAFLRRRQLKSRGFYTSGTVDNLGHIEPGMSLGADYDQTVEGLFGTNGWRKMLESLTEGQRETLRLHFFEGCTFAEIAERLGDSYANVRNHHYRGLKKLRKQLAEDPFKQALTGVVQAETDGKSRRLVNVCA